MADDGTPGYDADIKPLFRNRDKSAMAEIAGFDLWSYDDVRSHSQAILQRVQAGSMPCDGAWPPDKVQLFQRWVDTGMNP